MISVDEVFKNRNMTFEDIDKLNYKQFGKPGPKGDQFQPSDILDLDDPNDSDDEILRKFRRKQSPTQRRNVPYVSKKYR